MCFTRYRVRSQQGRFDGMLQPPSLTYIIIYYLYTLPCNRYTLNIAVTLDNVVYITIIIIIINIIITIITIIIIMLYAKKT
jgi:hypothetical protein